MRAPPIAIGETVAEKYVVERVLGEGGMGIVLAARHLELDQRVAIKCLLPEIAQRGVAAERFRREARAVANMRSEHVCRVLDVGTLSDGIPFMIMEYLDGCDLSQELERRERLPYSEAVAYVLQACEALSEAHQAGIIHRDLKPANLFLEQRANGVRRLKVLDFGVSKSLLGANLSNAALTQTANLVGSPLYMSPEQLESSRDVDARADIWGLGVVLYELISGLPPFTAASIPQLIAAVINERPRRFPAELTPRVPAELEAVIMRTLSKDRRDRPASIDALMEELEPFAATLTAAGRTTHLGSTPADARALPAQGGKGPGLRTPRSPTQTSQTPLSWDRDDKARPSRLRWALGAVLIVLLATAALFAYSSYQGAGVEPGMAKPLPQGEAADKPAVGAAAQQRGPGEPGEPGERGEPAARDGTDRELPRGASTPPQDVENAANKAAGVLPPPAANTDQNVRLPNADGMDSKAADDVAKNAAKQAASMLPPTTAKPVARPTLAPAVNPVPVAKPAPQSPPTPSSPRGAPPRGQISDFGGRR